MRITAPTRLAGRDLIAAARVAQEQGATVLITGIPERLRLIDRIAKRLPKEVPHAIGLDVTNEDEVRRAVDAATAWRLLNDHRVGIELLYTALKGKQSPWLPVVEALRATLPELQGDDEEALRHERLGADPSNP